jgi:hypothetical protein
MHWQLHLSRMGLSDMTGSRETGFAVAWASMGCCCCCCCCWVAGAAERAGRPGADGDAAAPLDTSESKPAGKDEVRTTKPL